ncbi:MAG: hypothetical protein GYA47_04695 [Desulfovibrio sp.]|nr:hypothetical protein [Desulfovibrio sp.]
MSIPDYRRVHFPRITLLVMLLLLLPGCAILNEGAINYRKQKFTPAGAAAQDNLELVKKFDTEPNKDKAILSSREDVMSIHLTQGFIKDFTELALFGGRRGEIAIVVNVSSLKDAEMNFQGTALNSGRLVYYDDDVRKKQYLNFAYIPVYGPVKYDGYPLAMQIYIIEMDAGDSKLKPLLQTMASIGSSLYAPAAPILSLLDSLGSAILSGNTDDIIMCYHMTFYPNTGELEAGYPVLETGNYVLVRRENRNEGPAQQGEGPRFDWDRVTIDPKEGRLVWADNPKMFFTDETYLVFQVQRGFPAGAPTQTTTYASLRTALNQAAQESGQNLADAVKGYAAEIINTSIYNDLHSKIREIINSGCITDEATRYLSWNFVSDFTTQINRMDSENEKEKIGTLTAVQKTRLLSLLSEASGMTTDALTTALENYETQKTIVEAIVAKKKAAAKTTS